MANFDNQVVVITGASSGIGAALAQEFGRRGAKVVLTARRKDKLEEVARLCGPSAYVVPGDMTRREDVQAVFAAAKQKFGQLDIWVNNAGRGISKAFGELVDSDIDAMMRDNLKSALYGMQTVLPYFKEKEQMRAYATEHKIAVDSHAGFDDTSQVMFVDRDHKWIRKDKLVKDDGKGGTGVTGDQTIGTVALGKMFVGYKIKDAVDQLREGLVLLLDG